MVRIQPTDKLNSDTGGTHTFKQTTVYSYAPDTAEPVKLTVLKHGDCCCGKEEDREESILAE